MDPTRLRRLQMDKVTFPPHKGDFALAASRMSHTDAANFCFDDFDGASLPSITSKDDILAIHLAMADGGCE